MKIYLKVKRYPELGDHREKSWYALCPVKIKTEIRWLERVNVVQTFKRFEDGDYWSNVRFIDELTIE
jgi:hypothetical protein